MWEAEDIAREWHRVLRPGGLLVMEMPSLPKVIRLIQQGTEKSLFVALLGLYGNWLEKRPEMTHKWTWAPQSLTRLLTGIGFSHVRCLEPKTHVPERDFRVEATK